jgi:methionyl-tRNA synthetase
VVEPGLDPQAWADRNAAAFEETFARLGMTNDDFIRTTQRRHRDKVTAYIGRLMESGDVYLGQYEGWYDAGQEEYVTEGKAAEYEYRSPINGHPLVRKAEENAFFRLSAYGDRLLEFLAGDVVQPEARRNELLARVREGLNDVPISRTGSRGWGIPLPGNPEQTVYVWIDALFNYLSAVDTPERERLWPADVHLLAKDILWFHGIIWPALLMALGRPLPRRVYAHSFWIAEGRKMSKSLGNFVDLERIDGYVERFGLDALRYFLATQGPLSTTDADFAEAQFIETYNAELANTLGNSFSRVSNMTARYFDGRLPEAEPGAAAVGEWSARCEAAAARYSAAMEELRLDTAFEAAMELVRQVDAYIQQTQPFKLAKQEGAMPQVGTILYCCMETLRIASLMLWPVMPERMEALWLRTGQHEYAGAVAQRGRGRLAEWLRWGGLRPGTPVEKGEALFPRHAEE